MSTPVTTIDDYIKQFPEEIQSVLQQMRSLIKQTVPQAEEAIAYGIPTFRLTGNLVHFGAFRHHIGFYPTPDGLEEFKDELSLYKGAKGSVQFPYSKPLPVDLIRRIVEYRMQKMTPETKKK